jgi:hypothetical protein
MAQLKFAAETRSMINKPAGTVVWLFKCTKCDAVRPFFKHQTATFMKYGLSGIIMHGALQGAGEAEAVEEE